MKVVPFIVSAVLALTGAARADEYSGPLPSQPMAQQAPPPPMAQPMRPRGALRQALLEQFDANHDGRLEPNERRQAVRALRRIARQLARQDRRAARAEHRAVRQAIRRYDLNGDGNVDPSEMPPAAAERLRPLDRNGDGWVDERDFR
jgi:hypothetical protein